MGEQRHATTQTWQPTCGPLKGGSLGGSFWCLEALSCSCGPFLPSWSSKGHHVEKASRAHPFVTAKPRRELRVCQALGVRMAVIGTACAASVPVAQGLDTEAKHLQVEASSPVFHECVRSVSGWTGAGSQQS